MIPEYRHGLLGLYLFIFFKKKAEIREREKKCIYCLVLVFGGQSAFFFFFLLCCPFFCFCFCFCFFSFFSFFLPFSSFSTFFFFCFSFFYFRPCFSFVSAPNVVTSQAQREFAKWDKETFMARYPFDSFFLGGGGGTTRVLQETMFRKYTDQGKGCDFRLSVAL